MTIQLRQYQEDGLNALWSYFMTQKGNPVLAHPTGTGKSLIPAVFIYRTMQYYPNQRFMLLTHVSELVKQDAAALRRVWPEAPLGIYSAQLKQKDIHQPIIYGNIQSAGRNPHFFGHRDICFVDECFSDDTEILTTEGFIRFDKLGLQDIAQYDEKTKEISFTKPIRYVRTKPASPVLNAKTDKGIDVLATANHDMLITSSTGNWQKRKLKDVVAAHYCRLPVSGLGVGEQNELTHFEKFVIAFQADGSVHKHNNDGSSISAFSFSKQRKIDEFLNLMWSGGFKWREVSGKCEHGGNVKDRRRFMVFLPDHVSKDVTDYFEISKLSAKKCYDIIEYMNIWDGNVASKNSYLCTNTDKKAADFYQAVATLAGHRTNLVKVVDNRSEKFSDVYRLFIIKNRQTITSQGMEIKETVYNGEVYCVEMPKGTVVTRRNGKVIVTGNCHLVSPDDSSMYQKFFGQLKIINPNLKLIGLSATPYRIGQGMIVDDGLFTHICHDLTSMANFNKLIADGYLSPLIPKKTQTELDVTNVGIQKGEYNLGQLQHEVDKAEITWKALQETVYYGQNRKSWLIYATGIDHSNHIAEMLNQLGIECSSVHSKQTDEYNTAALKAHKELKLRAIVSYSKLTTGLDHPDVDMIVCLRPTCSVALWVQMLGRGTRPAVGKTNCLVLDFARNVQRLGPINDPIVPKKKGDKTGDVPIKLCEKCGVYNHISARTCDACGEPFHFEVKFKSKSSTDELIKVSNEQPIIETFDVTYVIYKKHEKIGKPPTLMVTYFSGTKAFKEWVTLEHSGLAKHRAHEWWRQRSPSEPPATVDEARELTDQLRMPRRLRIHVNKKPYMEILSCEF